MAKQTALITGASSGIGEEFARRLAGQGMDLILVARSQAKLEEMAATLSSQFGITAHVITADLSAERAAKEVSRQTREKGLHVDFLINNAGFGSAGEFVHNDAEQEHLQVMVNVTTVVDMIHEYLPAMVEKRSGTIINVASLVAFQPVPHMAVYGATKAFVLSLSEALWEENRKYGVKVLGLCPGATATNFFEVAKAPSFGKLRSPEQVVSTALRALQQGRSFVVDGASNAISSTLPRILPRKVVAKVAGNFAKPKP
jgi:short-subunit dehydrogenase